MFCKSGILIFIFAENNYSIYAHTMLIKTPLLHQSSGPRVFLSLSFSGYFIRVQRPSEFTFLPGLLRPSWEGTLCLHPIERAPEASVNRARPVPGALLAFCVNQGISASFSLLYFLIGWLWTTRFWSIKGPQHIGKDPDAGKDWGQEQKGTTEDEMVGWHHWFNEHEFEQTPGDWEGQGSLACCSSWGRRVGHNWTTEHQSDTPSSMKT